MCGLSVISLFSIEVKGKVFFFFYWNFDKGSMRWEKNTEGQVQNRFKGRSCQETRQCVIYMYIYVL